MGDEGPRPCEIALGLDRAFNKILAQQTGAADFTQWKLRGVTRRSVRRGRFGRAFHQAAFRATRIHFVLDELGDLEEAVREGRRGFCPGNFTNAELREIVLDPGLLAKTTFYRGAPGAIQAVPNPF